MKMQRLAIALILIAAQSVAVQPRMGWPDAEALLQRGTNFHGRSEVTMLPSGGMVLRSFPSVKNMSDIQAEHTWFVELASTRMPTNDVERYKTWIREQADALWWAASTQCEPAFSNAWFAVADFLGDIRPMRRQFTPEYCNATFFHERDEVARRIAQITKDNSKETEETRRRLNYEWSKAFGDGRRQMLLAWGFQCAIGAAENRLKDILLNEFIKNGVSCLDKDERIPFMYNLAKRARFTPQERKDAEALLARRGSPSQPIEP